MTSPMKRSLSRRMSVEAVTGDNEGAMAKAQMQADQRRLQEMGDTLVKMHGLLKQMQERAASSKSRAATDNLKMWELMIGDLDKSFEAARLATRARQDLEARRASMYAQAARRAEAEAQAAHEKAAKASSGDPAAVQAPAASEGAKPSSPGPATAIPPSLH